MIMTFFFLMMMTMTMIILVHHHEHHVVAPLALQESARGIPNPAANVARGCRSTRSDSASISKANQLASLNLTAKAPESQGLEDELAPFGGRLGLLAGASC